MNFTACTYWHAVRSRKLYAECLSPYLYGAFWPRQFHASGLKNSGRPTIGNTASADEKELGFFRQLSDQWWQSGGDFRALHAMNEIRVPFVTDAYIAYGLQNQLENQRMRQNSPYPLESLRILDVGCGGGLLSEPLARLGGNVTGIDMVAESIRMAKLHYAQSVRQAKIRPIEYLDSSVEDLTLTRPGFYDLVVCSEVVEHASNVDSIVGAVAALTRPGGVAIFSTINRTIVAFSQAIVAAEYMLRLVPRGTHHYSKFVAPDELDSMLRRYDFDVRLKHGARYNLLLNRWSWTSCDAVNYFLAAVKN